MAMTQNERNYFVRCNCGTILNIIKVREDYYHNLTIVDVEDHLCRDKDEVRDKKLKDAEYRRDEAIKELNHYKEFMKMMRGVA